MKSEYLNDINLLEEPLIGVNVKLHNIETRSQMTDEELRAWVQDVRTKRESRQTFKAACELRGKTESKENQAQSFKLFSQFAE
jgi:hypothetical protein